MQNSVDSSAIASIEYTQRLTGYLDVKFKSGSIYRYVDVPDTVHQDFMASSSKGKFFQDFIKDMYKFERLK